MRKLVFILSSLCLLISFSLNLYAGKKPDRADYVQLENLPRACLPEFDRIDPNALSDPEYCHCPPQNMCNETFSYKGKNDDKSKNYDKLPKFFKDYCCNQTQSSATLSSSPANVIKYVHKTGSICPTPYIISSKDIRICQQYQMRGSFTPMQQGFINEMNQCLTEAGIQSLIDIAIQKSLNEAKPWVELTERPELLSGGTDELQQIYQSLFSTSLSGCQSVGRRFSAYSADKTMLPQNVMRSIFIHNQIPPENIGPFTLPGIYSNFYEKYLSRAFPSGSAPTSDQIARAYQSADNFLNQFSTDIANTGTPATEYALDVPYAECSDWVSFEIEYTRIANDGSCGSCLSPETQIMMADDTYRAIKDLKEGDIVKSARGKAAKISEVVKIDWPELTLYNINSGKLRLTADHPIMTTKGWRAINYDDRKDGKSYKRYGMTDIGALKVGDVIILEDKSKITVETLAAEAPVKDGVTYNLRLEAPHSSFYANGILVKSNK